MLSRGATWGPRDISRGPSKQCVFAGGANTTPGAESLLQHRLARKWAESTWGSGEAGATFLSTSVTPCGSRGCGRSGALYPAKGRRRARPSIWGGHRSETSSSAVAGSKSGFPGGCTQWPPPAAFLGQPQGKLSRQPLPWHCKEKGCSYVEEGEGQYCCRRERRSWGQARSILEEERKSVHVFSGTKQ